MADQGTPQLQECGMDVGPSFVANFESAVLMEPAFSAFHNPAINAQSASVGRAAFGQHRACSSSAKFPAVRLGIISAIALSPLEATAGSADFSRHRRHGVHHRQQLRHIVTVGRAGAGVGLCVHADAE